jgi:hypothetical protein
MASERPEPIVVVQRVMGVHPGPLQGIRETCTPMTPEQIVERKRLANPTFDGGTMTVQDCATGERWEVGLEYPIAPHVKRLVVRNPNLDPSSFPVPVWIVSRMTPKAKEPNTVTFNATCSTCGHVSRATWVQFTERMELICGRCSTGDKTVRTIHSCVRVASEHPDLVA